MTSTPMELYEAGQLDEAVEASLAAVKVEARPMSPYRFQLAELSCIAGDLDRADQTARHGHQPGRRKPPSGPHCCVNSCGPNWAAENVSIEGRVPEFLGEPFAETLKSYLEGPDARAQRATLLRRAAEAIGPVVGRKEPEPRRFEVNGENRPKTFAISTTCCHLFWKSIPQRENTFWVDWNQILDLDVHPPKRPFDLLWRQASLSIESGPDGEVYHSSDLFGA